MHSKSLSKGAEDQPLSRSKDKQKERKLKYNRNFKNKD